MKDADVNSATGCAADNILAAVARLQNAVTDGIACSPVRDLLVSGDIATAYAVQSRLIEARVAAGERIVGRKVGLTNPAVQAQLNVSQPDFGTLLDEMACAEDEPIDIRRLLQPKIEAEVAFILARDLDQAETIMASDVVAATRGVRAALEIVDSRVAGWDITIVDTIADNASSGLFVLGRDERPLTALDLAAVHMTLHRGDEVVSTGTGADCLGSPISAVAWLANTARDHGMPLRAGEIVLSGALGPMVPVLAGATYTADVVGLGTVTARFSDPVRPIRE
jgi:2-keto-4-pentenoate hydratase